MKNDKIKDEECMDFFEDICAETELRSIGQRFDVAGMLSKEKKKTESEI